MSIDSRDDESQRNGRGVRWFVACTILAPWIWLFGDTLISEESFVFRDAAHYYYPLFEWTAEQWKSGHVPLWNPNSNLGVPQVAHCTSSVFYPGKLILFLPLGHATLYKAFITVHVLIAAGAMYALARRFARGTTAAGLASLSYAFSGSVLFQYCNVPFLIGAAWLPLAILMARNLAMRKSLRHAVGLGLILALMVLGGDPQMAYNAGLLAAALVLFTPQGPYAGDNKTTRGCVRTTSGQVSRRSKRARRLSHRLILLSVAALTAFLLSAIQVLPSVQWTKQSQRTVYQSPRSLYELAKSALASNDSKDIAHTEQISVEKVRPQRDGMWHGMFGRPAPTEYLDQVYQFSVGPWRWFEFVWPNFGGKQFPVNQRWMNAIPAEGRIWSPSLYMGLVPFLLALLSMRFRHVAPQWRWATWVALIGIAGSLGGYGAGWLIDEAIFFTTGNVDGSGPIGRHVGGLYWLMTVVLPGYVCFRYPAKLMVVASLGLSLLASRGWDACWRVDSFKFRRIVVPVTVLSALMVLATVLLRGPLSELFSKAPADRLFGPLDIDGAIGGLTLTFVHSTIIGLAACFLARSNARGPNSTSAVGMLMLVSLDVAFAHRWLAPTAPAQLWNEPSVIAEAIKKDRENEETTVGRRPRYYRSRDCRWPRVWSQCVSKTRQTDGLVWDKTSLYPKYHLQDDLNAIEVTNTLLDEEYRTVLDTIVQLGSGEQTGSMDQSVELFQFLGARYFVLPRKATPSSLTRIDLRAKEMPNHTENISLWKSTRENPRAWIVRNVEVIRSLPSADPRHRRRITRQVYLPGGDARNLRRQAVVESTTPEATARRFSRLDPSASSLQDICQIALDEPLRKVIDVRIAESGLLVLADRHTCDWSARLVDNDGKNSQPVAIWKTNRVMCGVFLPAGKHRVEFRYSSRTFYWGAALSSAAWIAIAIAWLGVVGKYVAYRSRTTQSARKEPK